MTDFGPNPQPSATFIGSFALVGRVAERVAALAQILVVASLFGSGLAADQYFIASIVPLMLGSVLGEAFAAAALPALERARGRQVVEWAASGLWLVAATLAAATLAYAVAATIFVQVATPAGSAALLWLVFATITFTLGLSGYLGAVLLRYERYVWPPFRLATAALAGLAFTVVAALFSDDVVWIAAGVAGGYAVSVVLMLAEIGTVAGGSWLRRPTREGTSELLRQRRNAASAVASGLIGGQLFVLMERARAATLGVGAVATLSYARGTVFSPNAVGQAIAAGVYPGMVRSYAAERRDDVVERLVRALRLTVFVGIPFLVFFEAFGTEVAALIFERGAFDTRDAAVVGDTVNALAPALLGNLLLIVAWRTLYAIDYFRATVWSMLTVLAVYGATASPFRAEWGVTGLAAAFSVAELAGGLVAVSLAVRRIAPRPREVFRHGLVPAVTGGALVGITIVTYRLVLGAVDVAVPLQSVVHVGGAVGVGTAAAAVVLWRSGWPEVDRLKRFLRQRLGLAA